LVSSPETSASPPLDAARHRAACARAEATRGRATRAARTASIAATRNMSCASDERRHE
jgi:predicted 2-oxoglutarate/Fe(II)-dependent dioxygenase YbiX